ncbi:MAG: hypothetical protein ACRDKB_11045 [Actinomycetota bacterium]
MKLTDLIVLAAALTGVVTVLLGLAHVDPRIRKRFGSAEATAGRSAARAAAMIVGGLVLVMLALGFFSD